MGSIGEGDGELSGARVELQSPSTFVCSVVMEAAQRQQILEVGRSQVIPYEEMMDVALVEVGIAPV
ncbi:MAG: hypothetical protein WA964_13835, partial [Ilumatobacter sp.]|uniref:hypothetical protein n=1 Tax=Ilumatobacter sp. TaxID=1967498 RepID=UPI003C74D71C